MHTLYAYGGNYHEDWRMNPKGGAISIKVTFTPSMDDMVSDRLSLPPQQHENSTFSTSTYSPQQHHIGIFSIYNYNKMPI